MKDNKKKKFEDNRKESAAAVIAADDSAIEELSKQYTPEQIAQAIAMVREEENKKRTRLQNFSFFWTLVSTLYAIVSVCIFIASGWVEHTLMYVLVGLLVAYIIAFVIMLSLLARKKDKASKHFKYYRKAIKIFKAISNVLLLAVTAVSMAGIAEGGMQLVQWLAFSLTFAVAVVQLGLKVAILITTVARQRVAKRFDVGIVRYVNGQPKRKTIAEKIKENSYKEK